MTFAFALTVWIVVFVLNYETVGTLTFLALIGINLALFRKILGLFFFKTGLEISEIQTGRRELNLKKLTVHPNIDDSFKKIPIPHRYDYILRSDELNDSLFNNEIHLIQNEDRYENLINDFKKESETNIEIIKEQFKNSIKHRKQFTNDKKIGIASSLGPKTKNVEVFKTSYYTSFLTNELCSKRIENKWSMELLIDGFKKRFPLNQNNQVKPIHMSELNNHIGASALAFTADKQICIWRQNSKTQRSNGLLAPTGSGSSDWEDFALFAKNDQILLKDVIIESMKREFSEESSKNKVTIPREEIGEAKILGYFRWLRFGGKPEFYGIVKVKKVSSNLHPDMKEVGGPKYDPNDSDSIDLKQPANNKKEMLESIDYFLSSTRLSVPLYVILVELQYRLNNNDEKLIEFLWPGTKYRA